MDLEHVQRLAQAFAQGIAFARGFTEMAQDAKDGEEDGHWVTIGGERGADGEKHGGRPVFISGSGTIKKGLSKSAQGKTLGQVFGKGSEFSSEGKKSKGETDRKAGERTRTGKEAGERASTKRAEAEKARKDATSRAKEFRQETKQIVANDLEPSVAKLKKALDANVPARIHDDLVDMHRLADQIGIMANKLCSLNSRYAENSKEPSAFVVSSHGQNAKGTAERVAKLARRSAAMAHDFEKPRDERSSYSDAQATSAIRDNLSELRGLHQDLLDHIRRIQEPEKRDEPKEDPLYAARGKVINGPAKAEWADDKSARRVLGEQKTRHKDASKELGLSLTNLRLALSDVPNLEPTAKDNMTDAYRLLKQIPTMSNKLFKLVSDKVQEGGIYGGFEVSNLLTKATGAMERCAKLANRMSASANGISPYPVASESQDAYSEIRGLHQDLLDAIRRAKS